MRAPTIQPAFHDAARESQAVFRTVMDAMAHPGRIVRLEPGFAPPAPLNPAATAILLALADFETPIWLDAALSVAQAVTAFLRFHTGARIVEHPDAAHFALIADCPAAPPLAAFNQGTPDYPDMGTTVILQVETLQRSGCTLAGPGIDGETAFGAAPVPPDFTMQLARNRSLFPRGVDVILAGQGEIAALPRSVRLGEAR